MGIAATLYCMLCTVGAATYVGSAAALYGMLCILCRVGAATCVGLFHTLCWQFYTTCIQKRIAVL